MDPFDQLQHRRSDEETQRVEDNVEQAANSERGQKPRKWDAEYAAANDGCHAQTWRQAAHNVGASTVLSQPGLGSVQTRRSQVDVAAVAVHKGTSRTR